MFVVFSIHFQRVNVLFCLRLFILSSKSIFVIKFACASRRVKTLADKLLNSGVVIFLWGSKIFIMIIINKLFFNFNNFCFIICFLTKVLTLGILSSTAVNADWWLNH